MESPVRVTEEEKRRGGGRKQSTERSIVRADGNVKEGERRRERKHGGVVRVQLVVLKFVVFGRSIQMMICFHWLEWRCFRSANCRINILSKSFTASDLANWSGFLDKCTYLFL